jgi:hypothetical protein
MPQRLSLKEALVKGLRPSDREARNAQLMVQYRNAQCTPNGARPFPSFSTLVSNLNSQSPPVSVSHPFPQIFVGKQENLMVMGTRIFSLNPDAGYDATELTVYTYASPYTTSTVIPSGGGTWHFADFHSTWFLFNGKSVLWKSKWRDANKIFIKTIPTIATGCSFRGRMLMGGFKASDFWSSEWQDQWNSWMSKGSGWGYSVGAPGPNWVWWSSIGGGDLLHLFDKELAIGGIPGITGTGHDADDPSALFNMLTSTAGFMPVDWQGTVWRLLPMKNAVVVYGEGGVSALLPFPEPIPTFGLEESILRIGIASRSAVAGDLKRHLFVDGQGVLWSLAGNLQLTRLGYEEYLSALLPNEITVFMDPDREEFYISGINSGGDKIGYKLTESGLCRTPFVPTAMVFVDRGGGLKLQGLRNNDADTNTITLETIPTDFGDRSIKTIEAVQWVGRDASFSTPFKLQPKFRYKENSALATGADISLDNRGYAYVGLSGLEFSFVITGIRAAGAEGADFNLDDIILEVTDSSAKLGLEEGVNA